MPKAQYRMQHRMYHIIRLFFLRDGFKRAEYLKKHRIFKSMGENCYYHPYKYTPEAELVTMGNNVVIASGVELITHDMSYTLLKNDENLGGGGKILSLLYKRNKHW